MITVRRPLQIVMGATVEATRPFLLAPQQATMLVCFIDKKLFGLRFVFWHQPQSKQSIFRMETAPHVADFLLQPILTHGGLEKRNHHVAMTRSQTDILALDQTRLRPRAKSMYCIKVNMSQLVSQCQIRGLKCFRSGASTVDRCLAAGLPYEIPKSPGYSLFSPSPSLSLAIIALQVCLPRRRVLDAIRLSRQVALYYHD